MILEETVLAAIFLPLLRTKTEEEQATVVVAVAKSIFKQLAFNMIHVHVRLYAGLDRTPLHRMLVVFMY